MRETTFLTQNEEKWKRVETILDKKNAVSSDEASKLFIELTDDLAYARTHYPQSVLTRYLNALTSGIYLKLTKTRKISFKKAVKYWMVDIPVAVGKHHNSFLIAFLFFLMCILIGAVSTHYDPTYPMVVLGERYVEMTLSNIQDGDPMAVYKAQNSTEMFLGITTNNIKVAAKTFAAGILFGLGTFYFLFTNGIMLGTFQYYFVTKGLFWESFLTIWIHGTLEISSIIVAAAAGIVLGRSFLFPGSYSRKKALSIQGRDAFKIFIGTVPLFVIAGFLESFVTRHTEMAVVTKLIIILTSLLFIVWYFVWLPIQLKRKQLK